ncbi:MAG TPA: 16S rRNA (adenine(1518)-N(6)/adenine(1519)-N(6))-dimethyltransferase RsmA [Methanocorpusculum sp.]|nr:16S rRNA (adenine(1518)-N(6)/adenine(1519)-N(6))-dimethyltransferase RsmA [Methanocorpusculum sp.]
MKVSKDQHFLIDTNAIELIADTIPVCGKNVLEIGPGRGALTAALLMRGANVRAIEVDKHLLPNLEQQFSKALGSNQLQLIRGDATKVSLPEFDLVIANLPYSISSKITFQLLKIGFESAVLMYQLEFGKRMLAQPGSREYGRLSVMTQTYANVEKILELPPKAFFPQPKVKSIVVKVTPRKPPIPIENRIVHAILVRELFSHRRKTIRNGLRNMKKIYDSAVITNFYKKLSVEVLDKRPEILSTIDFIDLSNHLASLIT